MNCSGPIIRLRWSQKHQARPDNRLQKRTTHTKQSLQPSTTRHSNITGQPEAALLDSNFSSVFDPAAVDGNYALSPSHGGDGWIDEAFGDMMPELMSFGLIPNATATSIQTPELLQMAEEFGPNNRDGGVEPKRANTPREGNFSITHNIFTDRYKPTAKRLISASAVVERPLNDYSTILVEYYFKDTAAILALYDSEMNPFRSTVSRVWTSSELIYCTLQSMAASFLSNVYPQLLHTGLYFRQKAIRLLNDLDDSAIHEQALIALFMIGGTASWFDVNDTGSEYFPRLKKHVQSLKTSGRMSPTGQSQAFFENTLACWEMFLAFVVDGDENEVFDSPHLPLLPADQEPEPGSIFPVVQIPHPVTGVAHEIHTTLARVGRLVRRNRRRAMSKQFLTRESILEAHREVDEAAELEIFLTNLQVPLESVIVQTGDSQTPTWHLTALAEVYRFVGLIQLYHVFPDTLVSRMSLQNSHAGGDVAQVSAHEAEERLRQFTLKAVEILRSIPAESGTKDFHPFLIVAVCSGLTIPIVEVSASPQAMAGLGNSLALVAADVHRARGFLRGRLQLLLHSLPKNPIQRCIDIVKATWAETDNRHESSGRPAYWMDVMMQNNWETFMA
ncbi:Fungal transcription factor [Fusarium oxysporum f. sp. vasinfectum]|nr:Fungal transcription factor [Fusarium oxysporum f. sp. vasinfectum]